MVLASKNNYKNGYRLVSVRVSVRIIHELPQTTCLVLCKRKLAKVAVYSPACSHCCRNKYLTPDYCGNKLESKGIGAGSSPIGYEGFVKTSKIQGNSYYFQMLIILSYIHIYIYLNLISNYVFLIIHHIIFYNLQYIFSHIFFIYRFFRIFIYF